MSPSALLRSVGCWAIALWIVALVGGCGRAGGGAALGEASSLSPSNADVALSRELLHEALDGEALYTVAGGLKPLSTGFWSGRFSVESPDLSELERIRAAVALWRSDELYADVQVFATAHDGSRSIEAYVVDRRALAGMIERTAAFWSPLGVTPTTHPAEVVAIVDRLPRADRWRAYGHLFGYPAYAIDFFVDAGERARETGAQVGPGKDREFYHVPTFAKAEGAFTWAVPLGHVERAEDVEVRALAGETLDRFRTVRERVHGLLRPEAAIDLVRRRCTPSRRPTPRRPRGRSRR